MKKLVLAALIAALSSTAASAMTQDAARSVVTAQFPAVIMDPVNPDLPQMLVLRKEANGAPYSIYLPFSLSTDTRPQAAKDAAEQTTLVNAITSWVNQ